MIVKKIPARRDSRHAGSRRAKHVRDLVDYMRSPEKESPLRDYLVAYMASQGFHDGPERLMQIGARNFVCDDLDGQRAEMMAVAQAAVRSRNPIDHWLLSWRERELPSMGQVDETIGIFVKELGLSEHQCIFAVHGDTHNRHVHIALNRYNPVTGKVVTINKGFYKEAAHKAVARIVDQFGWKAEAEARYVIANGRPVLSGSAKAKKEQGKPALRNGATAFEVRTGFRSVQRIAQEEAVPIILAARSWVELHAGLADIGITYEAVGTNGAVLAVGDEGVRSSQVSRHVGRTGLEKRLGPFQPRTAELLIAHRPPEVDRLPGAFRADEYRDACLKWRAMDRAERRRTGSKQPAADLETWLHDEGEAWAAEQWRKRNLRLDDFCSFEGAGERHSAIAWPLHGFRAHECREGIRYARDGEGTAFIDRGNRVTVLSQKDDEALLAALKLAIHKFDGRVRIIGDRETRRRIEEVALRKGLAHHLINPEFVNNRPERHSPGKIGSKRVTPVMQSEPVPAEVISTLQQLARGPNDGPASVGGSRSAEDRKAAAKRLSSLARGPGVAPPLSPMDKSRGR